MKILKKTTLIFISIIAILVIVFFVYAQYQKPKYEGELALKNISKTTNVYFDDYGIPHIYADNQHDAMVALGYVHAQDRLWQMELLRRIAPGRLSEIFGTRALKNDVFFAGCLWSDLLAWYLQEYEYELIGAESFDAKKKLISQVILNFFFLIFSFYLCICFELIFFF